MGEDQGGHRTLIQCSTGSNGSRPPRGPFANYRGKFKTASARVKKLEGDENAWRIRMGEFRVVYEIHDAVLMVMVLRVANRRDAYR